MPEQIERGKTITLDAFFFDATNASIDPTPDPQVSIIDSTGTTVVNLDAPTRAALGHWQYKYAVAADAPLGAWAAQWFATINSVDTADEDGFTVVVPGGSPSIEFGFQHEHATCTPWATSADVVGHFGDWPGSTDILDEACAIASDILYELTGRRWAGQCHDIIRPTAQWRSYPVPMWWPGNSGNFADRGAWGYCSCNRGRDTGCSRIPEIKLPGNPVDSTSIVVTINGAPFTAFALHDHRYLVRTDGNGWPCCQDLTKPPTEPNTWQVAYDHSQMPPPGGKLSAEILGREIGLFIDPAADTSQCKLPERVTTITRQGVTAAVLDPMALAKDGLTGLKFVDQWVQSVLFGRKRRGASVLIPGSHRSARRIT